MRTFCRGSNKRRHLDAVSTRTAWIALLSMALSQLPFWILNRAIESFHGGRIDEADTGRHAGRIRLLPSPPTFF